MTSAFREAVTTMAAAIATMLCALAIAPGPGPAVLSVVLAVSLSRSHLDHTWRQRIEAALSLPAIGLVAVGIGTLLLRVPWLGAAVFTAGMFVSIWIRRFGPNAHRAGSMIALPFVALLVTPRIPTGLTGALPVWLVPICIALLASLWVGALQALARRVGLLVPLRVRRSHAPDLVRTSTLRPIASTRMAIQMAAALAVSFATGYLFFPDRWAWIVLTAFIVLSGNQGRLDVAYKSVQRITGAAVGTILALSISLHAPFGGFGSAALILAAVFFGVWLRPLNYAWWALFVTIALAMLQGFTDAPPAHILLQRSEEIVIGAAIGVACAWWLLPVRSTGVLRARIADALRSLGDALQSGESAHTPETFLAALARVERLAPAFRAGRYVLRSRNPQPADWIDALVACTEPAVTLIENGATPPEVRRAVGAARKAMLEPSMLTAALCELRDALAPYRTASA